MVITRASRSNHKPKVFVAYPYGLYPRDEYRILFKDLQRLFNVTFSFADQKITSKHILHKIRDLILASEFGIYDITGWNPNVTLELGLAQGLKRKVYIAIDPTKAAILEAPADLRGFDRMQFTSLGEFRRQLHTLLYDHFKPLGRILHALDLPWSPIGQPKPTQMVYAAVFRDIMVHLVPNVEGHRHAIADLSFRVESREWSAITYDSAPWINIEFLDKDRHPIQVAGSMNWVVAEFNPNDNRYIYSQKELLSDQWHEVAAVNVWASRGYAISSSWTKNLSLSMILARLRRFPRALRRRQTHQIISLLL